MSIKWNEAIKKNGGLLYVLLWKEPQKIYLSGQGRGNDKEQKNVYSMLQCTNICVKIELTIKIRYFASLYKETYNKLMKWLSSKG